jgi:hypothetical protein
MLFAIVTIGLAVLGCFLVLPYYQAYKRRKKLEEEEKEERKPE